MLHHDFSCRAPFSPSGLDEGEAPSTIPAPMRNQPNEASCHLEVSQHTSVETTKLSTRSKPAEGLLTPPEKL